MKKVGDITKHHLHKMFKTVPMKDEEGKIIPDNPPLLHGGPWQKVPRSIRIDRTKGKGE